MSERIGTTETVWVDDRYITGTVYNVRENGWACVETEDGRLASGPSSQYSEDNSRVVSVWSVYGHRFMSDGEPPYESCLTCGAMYQLLAYADDPTSGAYLAANGDEPRQCTGDTSMSHGYEDASDPECNCVACDS